MIGIVILLSLAVLLGPASGWGAILVRDYELNGSFADALGGPAINPDSGTLNPTNYSFNGVQQISFTDATGLAIFTGPNDIMRFFEDDVITGTQEASAGVVDFIKIYKGALTAAEVRALEQAVPEPTTLLLTGFGLGTLAVTAWRRRESR